MKSQKMHFHIAINKGNTQIIQPLLSRPDVDININEIEYKNKD